MSISAGSPAATLTLWELPHLAWRVAENEPKDTQYKLFFVYLASAYMGWERVVGSQVDFETVVDNHKTVSVTTLLLQRR